MAFLAGLSMWCCTNTLQIEEKEEYRDVFMPSRVVAAPDAIITTGSEILSNTFDDFKMPDNYSQEASSRAIDKNNSTQVEVHLWIGKVNTILQNVGNKIDAIDTDVACNLSMHVRYPGDVEVIMPVPEDLYCDPDSLVYYKGVSNFEFKGEKASFKNVINGMPVTLHIEYVAEKDDYLTNPGGVEINGLGKFGSGYIRVYTEGITDDLFAYLKKKYHDGLNFKIYSYFKLGNLYANSKSIDINEDDLRVNFLDHSLVNFDWQQTDVALKKYPELYINSFSADEEGNPIESESYVWILGDKGAKKDDNGLFNRVKQSLRNGTQVTWNDFDEESQEIERNHYRKPYQENHFNNSPYNWIYTWTGVEP